MAGENKQYVATVRKGDIRTGKQEGSPQTRRLQPTTAEEAFSEPKQRIAINSTWTNRRTGESETWHDVGPNGENIPVAKTLPKVTVKGKAQPKQRLARKVAEKTLEYASEELGNRLGPALSKYGEEYQDIWKRGGYKPRRFERPEPEGKIEYRRQRKNPDTGEWEDVE